MSTADLFTRLNAALEGRYRIERKLGEGGMATVYLAADVRHERKVALKVLKPELAAVVGAERFLTEIKTTANLHHPHILPLHDSGDADGFLFYVMPYVEGETLRERIDREKQLPVEEAVRIATAVANALQHAHDRGVIHRDIKPGNILLQDGEPVVSDFGIALAVGSAGGARLTETGLSVGTPYYMSPEQATGDQHVGPSSDLYALAAVLYEMLTGDPPYIGSTAQAVLGQIIAGEAISATKKRRSIPPNVDAALSRALEKLPADRFTSAQDFARALSDPSFRHRESAAAGRAGWGAGGWPVVATTAVLASVITGAVTWGVAATDPSASASTSRFTVPLPAAGALRDGTSQPIEVTRDGGAVVFNVARLVEGRVESQLFLRDLGSLEAVPIRGTENIGSFFLSPDGTSVGFNDVSDNAFKRIPLSGGPPTTIVPTGVESGGMRGLMWGEGTIVYSTAAYTGVMSVSDLGGTPVPLTEPPEGEVHRMPHLVPGGEVLLFVVDQGPDRPPQIGAARWGDDDYEILTIGTWPHYVDPGLLVFQRDDALFSVAFDPNSLSIRGEPVAVLEGLPSPATNPSGNTRRRLFSVSPGGTLAYASGVGTASGSLVRVSREGLAQPLALEAQSYVYPRLSPSGDRLASAVIGEQNDIWVFDLDRGSRSRVTFGGVNRFYPTWHPDGQSLFYADGATGSNSVRRTSADGSGGAETVLELEGLQYPTSWSSDGALLAYHEDHPETARDLWVLPEGGEPQPVLVTPFQEWAASFSPDGDWLAYVSDKSGRAEVYVRPYPEGTPEFTISTEGGTEPVWSRDGSELFYRVGGQMMAVTTNVATGFRPEAPRTVWADSYIMDPGAARGTPNYDVSPDGDFIMIRSDLAGQSEIVVVLDWDEELKRLVVD